MSLRFTGCGGCTNVLVVSAMLVAAFGVRLHIADVNILLPPKMTHFVEYRLQGSDGCFKWSWDHHDILSVLPEFNSSGHCTTSERLRSIAPYSGRKETAVYATDVLTGMMGLLLHVHAFDDEVNISFFIGLCRGNFTISFSPWSVLNSLVAQVDTMMGFGHALSLGVTSVIVEDARVAGHTQMSSPHVVVPDTLHLYMLPLSHYGDPIDETNPIPSVSRWYVVSGRNYLILMKVFSRGPGAKEIYITENDDVELHDDQSGFWNTLPISDDIAVKHALSNSRILEATSYGLGKLAGTLTYRTGEDGTKEAKKPGKATIDVVSNFDPFNYDEFLIVEISEVDSSALFCPKSNILILRVISITFHAMVLKLLATS
ncbi:Nuclear pore complex protein GP210 [Camellia lanceoleosa]|nr:Nuclear pore complex protein GP210 [Camellia lanceoleosa]